MDLNRSQPSIALMISVSKTAAQASHFHTRECGFHRFWWSSLELGHGDRERVRGAPAAVGAEGLPIQRPAIQGARLVCHWGSHYFEADLGTYGHVRRNLEESALESSGVVSTQQPQMPWKVGVESIQPRSFPERLHVLVRAVGDQSRRREVHGGVHR